MPQPVPTMRALPSRQLCALPHLPILLLSWSLASPSITFGQSILPTPIFNDVYLSRSFVNQVHLLAERMITTGCQAFDPFTGVPSRAYCPDRVVTRGEAAVLIVRSLYSIKNGDPDSFINSNPPYPTGTAYFPEDVPVGHPFFPYVQMIAYLKITNGCRTNAFCVDDPVTHGQLAVLTWRAIQWRAAQYPLPYTPPVPQACQTDYYTDVLQGDAFCPYIVAIANSVYSAIPSGCPSGYFCRDWGGTRGNTAFYSVGGILGQNSVPSLPNAGSLPQYNEVGNPNECTHGDLVFNNYIIPVALSSGAPALIADAGVAATSTNDANVWSYYTKADLIWSDPSNPSNTFTLFSNTQYAPGAAGGARVTSPPINLNASQNFLAVPDQSIYSACLAGGNAIKLSTHNEPVGFSVKAGTPTTLYPGMTRSVTIRGSSLERMTNVYGTYVGAVNGSGQTYSYRPASNVSFNSSTYEATISLTVPPDATVGPSSLLVYALSPNTSVPWATGVGGLFVGDPTPILNPLNPNTGVQGSIVSTTLTGSGFGGSPRVCVNGVCSSSGFVSVNGLVITHSTLCPVPCNAVAIIANLGNATVGSYSISVQSTGAQGNGFVTPDGGSFPFSQTQMFTVVGSGPIISSVQPDNSRQGDVTAVNITGQFLQAATLSGDGDLSISNVATTANQLSATIAVSGASAIGAHTITVSSAAGVVAITFYVFPTVAISGDDAVPEGDTSQFSVSLSSPSPNEPIILSISTSSGTGGARFVQNGLETEQLTVTSATLVTIVGGGPKQQRR